MASEIFRGSLFGSAREANATATAEAPNIPPTTVALFGSDYRMASWGVRFDITANDPNDPKYVPAWRKAIGDLRNNPQAAIFTEAVSALIEKMAEQEMYEKWEVDTIAMLKPVASPEEFSQVLAQQLDLLIDKMKAADPEFETRIITLRRAFMNYATVRDDLLRQIHSHRASFEYTNQHPLNQPNSSNFRFIYSHQPTSSPTLVTANSQRLGITKLSRERPPGASATSRLPDNSTAGSERSRTSATRLRPLVVITSG